MLVKSIHVLIKAFMLATCALSSLAIYAAAAPEKEEQLTPSEEMQIEERRLLQVPAEIRQGMPSISQLVKSVVINDDPYLYLLHPYAYYHPVAVSLSGDTVQLHDNSMWSVHPYQRHLVQGWAQSHDIFIKPKSSCFSMYKYVLHNRSTQQAVEVNWLGTSIEVNAYTHWIVNIDFYNRIIQLNDNSVWQIDPSDYAFDKWQIGHRLLVGVNNHWRVATFPHILINSSLYGAPYSEAACVAY